ncbi:heat-inducible transcriptional repressor HrcA [Defluviitalea phaphyphila]|uniref:heat-inducible transcriptional repressor HrcA n=1 Tax=Defluviitalea phaphyphila TaxID=1473580 RepID=UPI00073075DE|nr:heat-inducible transcriptional repressor HrcA [Defluviitalea phaphyphila]
MNLDDRKIKILNAIIKDYISTGEPVGSRTISKKYELGVSSATIRNEMSDLEEWGFIIQPHTSAGRIPSDKGYRLYVDQLMKIETINESSIKMIEYLLKQKIDQIDLLMKEVAKLLSLITNYTSMVSTPQIQKTRLKHLQLIPLDDKSVVLIIVTDANLVTDNVIKMDVKADQETLNKLSAMLNESLKGLNIEQINLPLIQELKIKMGVYGEIVNPILDAIDKTIKTSSTPDIYLSGSMNILNFPEFSDIEKAKQLFYTLEEKDLLVSILSKHNSNGIKITIGCENEIDEIKNCSLITASYTIGGRSVGTIGIIGPTRMQYEKVVSLLSYMSNNMDKLLNKILDG